MVGEVMAWQVDGEVMATWVMARWRVGGRKAWRPSLLLRAYTTAYWGGVLCCLLWSSPVTTHLGHQGAQVGSSSFHSEHTLPRTPQEGRERPHLLPLLLILLLPPPHLPLAPILPRPPPLAGRPGHDVPDVEVLLLDEEDLLLPEEADHVAALLEPQVGEELLHRGVPGGVLGPRAPQVPGGQVVR